MSGRRNARAEGAPSGVGVILDGVWTCASRPVPERQKSVGAPPSALRFATNAASSSRIAASMGGSSNSARIAL